MVFIVQFDSWWIRRLTSGEGACRVVGRGGGGVGTRIEYNFGNITSTMGFDSVPFHLYRQWMFSDSFRVFDFEVGGPSA